MKCEEKEERRGKENEGIGKEGKNKGKKNIIEFP